MAVDSTPHLPSLQSLAATRFTELSEAENGLLLAVAAGQTSYCGPSQRDDDTLNDPSHSGEWGVGRTVRAALIRWICIDPNAKEFVDPKGLRLHAARVAGSLDLSFITIGFPLLFNQCVADDLNFEFVNIPMLDLQGTRITSLMVDHSRIRGNVLLGRGFFVDGPVLLRGAEIGGSINCIGGTFECPAIANTSESGVALNLDDAKVAGSILLRKNLRVRGTVSLRRAQVGGNLDCEGGEFENPAIEGIQGTGIALQAFGVKVASRLKWIGRYASFTRQPFRQLAKVLKDSGDDRGWQEVSVEMERQARGLRGRGARLLSLVLRETIGYGYFSGRAVRWLIALVFLGMLIYWMGFTVGTMVPTQQDAYHSFVDGGRLPQYYEEFHALAYSLENSFPLVKLSVQDKWTPAPDSQPISARSVGWVSRYLLPITSPKFLRRFRWIQISAGWILATLFVGGITGLSRKD